MKTMSRNSYLAGCAVAGLLIAAGPAQAEAAGAADTGPEEIVVTAQKRTELLKDVPSSITAVTANSLQQVMATKLDDYVARIPGLIVSQAGGANAATQLTIRGLTTGAGGNPTVGVYIDESPFGGSSGVGGYTVPDLDPQDLARVEVLRGPQGTLYGAGSLGGLLKYVTADPDPKRFTGRVQVDGSAVDGGGKGYGMRGSVNMPLGEELALRVSGYNRRDPGYVDNVLTGAKNINHTRFYGGRAALGWQNDTWKVRASALYQHYSGSAAIVDYDSANFQPEYGDLKQSRANGTTNVRQNIGAYSLLVEGDLGFATLTSASSYNRQSMLFHLDYSTILSPIFAPAFGIPTLGFKNETPILVKKYTQEVRLASPASDTLSWQIGAFYTHETQDVGALVDPIDSLTGAAIAGLPVIGAGVSDTKFREVAAFGDATWHVDPAFDVTVGLRYSRNRQRNTASFSGLIFPASTITVRSRDDALTFLINPSYHLDENTMVYARVASGYRPGGPNTVSPTLPQSYGPDKVVNYELGLKSELLDRRLSLELSGFWIDWKDIQIQRVDALGSYIANGPSAVSKGLEATASIRPARGIELYGNITYTDAHLTRDLPPGSALAISGDRLPLNAKWAGAVGASYTVPLVDDWKGSLGVDWRHVGWRAGAFPNPGQVRFHLPAYDTVNLRAGINDDRWSFTAFVKNLNDVRGRSTDVNLGVGLTSVSVIQPRTFGLSAAAKF